MIGDDLALKAVQLLGEKVNAIEALRRQLAEHQSAAMICCGEECFCWVVEAWLNRMEAEECPKP